MQLQYIFLMREHRLCFIFMGWFTNWKLSNLFSSLIRWWLANRPTHTHTHTHTHSTPPNMLQYADFILIHPYLAPRTYLYSWNMKLAATYAACITFSLGLGAMCNEAWFMGFWEIMRHVGSYRVRKADFPFCCLFLRANARSIHPQLWWGRLLQEAAVRQGRVLVRWPKRGRSGRIEDSWQARLRWVT